MDSVPRFFNSEPHSGNPPIARGAGRYTGSMQRLQAFKFQLIPDGGQERLMRRFAGCRRFVYNKGLELQQKRQGEGEKKLGYAALCKTLTSWKRDPRYAWLREAHSQALQQALEDLDRAYTNFFESRAEPPRFKKKGYRDSFRYPQGVRLDPANARIFLPKLGWMKYRASREVLGEIRSATVSARAGKWFVSIQTEREVGEQKPRSRTPIGIDVGIVRFAAMSDGQHYAPLHSFRKHERALAKAQQSFARKRKFSQNWRKARAKVARIQARIADCRRDYLHQVSSRLSKNHALVCIEDLKVRNMSRSASGTKESPGTNVAAKSGLNKAILDQGWGEFERQLAYKLSWSGGILLAVPPENTSRDCPCCGHSSAENRQTQEVFLCTACGYGENADTVGGINVLSRGLRLALDEGRDIGGRTLRVRLPQTLPSVSRCRIARLACQANLTGGRQQEPQPSESREALAA